jgi:phosphoribosylformylglycinamidine synthase
MNPLYGDIDPYWMAASAIDEALRNVVAVGGRLDRTALLDNFCWGNTDKPDRLGGLLRAAQACYDMATVLGTPFISGKDSLNNEYKTESGESIAIPPTLLISAIAVMQDCRIAVSMDLKKPGNLLYLIGETANELGGSHYYEVLGLQSSGVPRVDPVRARDLFTALAGAIEGGLVRACHDCSEGGLGVALAEMAFAGGWGAEVTLRDLPRTANLNRSDLALFSESNSRFIVEVTPEKEEAFRARFAGLPCGRLGMVHAAPRLKIHGLSDELLLDETLDRLKNSWQETLRW